MRNQTSERNSILYPKKKRGIGQRERESEHRIITTPIIPKAKNGCK